MFPSGDLVSLMTYFEQVVSEADASPLGSKHYLTRLARLGKKANEPASDAQLSGARQRLEVVRFALVRAMSKSFLQENAMLSGM